MKILSAFILFGNVLVNASFGGDSLFESTEGGRCRAECLDAGSSWCSNLDYTRGICCTGGDWFCRIGRYCSTDIKTEADKAEGLKYWLCPQDQDICGKKDRAVLFNAAFNAQTLTVTVPAGSLCSYQFLPNIDAGPQDVLKVEMTEVTEVARATPAAPAPATPSKTPSQISKEPNPKKTQLAYAIGNEYLQAQGGLTAEVKGKSIQTTYPGMVYVSVLAPEDKDTVVKISFSISDVDPTSDWSKSTANPSDPSNTSGSSTSSGTSPTSASQNSKVDTTYLYANENVIYQPNGGNITLYIILVLSLIAVGLIIYYYIKTYDPKGQKVIEDLKSRTSNKKKAVAADDRWASSRPQLREPGESDGEDNSKVVDILIEQQDEEANLRSNDALQKRVSDLGHDLAARPPPSSNVKVSKKFAEAARKSPKRQK